MTVASTFRGVVVHGCKRGRVLGFPTANIVLDDVVALPDDGIFSCWVHLPTGERHGATMSVGKNPTFNDVPDRRIEVYLHDFDGSLYGQTLDIGIVQRLRGMVRFQSMEELIEQTQRDVSRSRKLLMQGGCT